MMTVTSLLACPIDVVANANPGTTSPPPVCDDYVPATVVIDAGEITNSTVVDLSADGGTAIGDSSGGDENLAAQSDDNQDSDRKNNDRQNRRDRNRDRENGDLAAAGNGGVSDASADGGAIGVENVNSGGNVGSAIAVGDTFGGYGCASGEGAYAVGSANMIAGGVYIDGGTVTNETIISVSADGGTAIADASGGDNNVAVNGGSAGNGGVMTSSAGNGGISSASADGGAVSIGDINSGGNAGNAIAVGDTYASPIIVPSVPGVVPVPVPGPEKTVPVVIRDEPRPGKVVVVTRLPSTGTEAPESSLAIGMGALALLSGSFSFAARRRSV
jgi:LPXTG-motif cell wall-anchored protein